MIEFSHVIFNLGCKQNDTGLVCGRDRCRTHDFFMEKDTKIVCLEDKRRLTMSEGSTIKLTYLKVMSVATVNCTAVSFLLISLLNCRQNDKRSKF